MSKIFIEFYDFLIKPNYKCKTKFDFKKLSYLTIFYIFSSYCLTFIISIILKYLNFEFNLNPEFVQYINENSLLKIIVLIPIVEEFLFRSILKPSRTSFFVFFYSLSYLILRYFNFTLFVNLIVSTLSIIFLYSLNINLNLSKKIYNKYYKVILYTSVGLFAILHLWNLDFNLQTLMFAPLLLAPKFVSGFSLSFIRIRFGLMFSISCHIIHNLPPLLFYLYVKQ